MVMALLLTAASAAFMSSGKPVCLPGKGLTVGWDAVPGADYYELQLVNATSGQAYAVYSTGGLNFTVGAALAGVTYTVQVRAHDASAVSLGPGTWGLPGDQVECTAGDAVPYPAHSNDDKTFWLEVARESEFTYSVDYLANHNSGDFIGDADWLSGQSLNPDRMQFVNITFRKAWMVRYCVQVLRVEIPDTEYGNSSFSDYSSCNDNHDPKAPTCSCSNWIDRTIAKQDTDKYCSKSDGTPCGGHNWSHDCTCNCTDAAMRYTDMYTGYMPVYNRESGERLGSWYAHPAAGECGEHDTVGKPRAADGKVCTWKRDPEARIVTGQTLLDFGWHSTQVPTGTLLQQDTAIWRSAYGAAPLSEVRGCGH